MSYGKKVLAYTAVLVVLLAATGCSGGGDGRGKVDEAVSMISSSRPLLEDLLELVERFDTLGTRYSQVEETIAEGKSLAEMALVDVDELESRYTKAGDLLRQVMETEGGKYAEYARLALEAVEIELEAFSRNRELLSTVTDMLDVLPMAESTEQLSFYVDEIDRLTDEIRDLLQKGSRAAEEADAYYRSAGL
ncbi:MAG: hypothetical protein H5T73_11370 [Actinobacteria bacterium]|nr:hypothetical protein [Actinomycetota bacterium]